MTQKFTFSHLLKPTEITASTIRTEKKMRQSTLFMELGRYDAMIPLILDWKTGSDRSMSNV